MNRKGTESFNGTFVLCYFFPQTVRFKAFKLNFSFNNNSDGAEMLNKNVSQSTV